MSTAKLLTQIAFACAMFGLSVGMTYFMVRIVRLLDVLNERSSHTRPVPKSGGVGIVVSFAVACLIVYQVAGVARIADQYFWGFLICSVALAAVSFLDDVTQSSFWAKILTQILCVAVMLGTGPSSPFSARTHVGC